MKYFIVGLHSSGKREIINFLTKHGIKCGKIFSDIEEPDLRLYESQNYDLYSTKDVNDIFENNAYIFIQRVNIYGKSFYEGLSKYEFENNDVFVLSPDQLTSVSFTNIKEPYCFIWLENTKINRYNRYRDEKRSYNFSDREEQEIKDLNYFVSLIYDNNVPVLYFNNEDPIRVSALVYTIVTYPELIDLYKQAFNN